MPEFVGARYGSLLTFDAESDGAISDVVLNVVWHTEQVESAKETIVACLERMITSFRYAKSPKARTRVSDPVMVDYAIHECKS